ncbi:hypothetical protein IHE49_00405 [Rhodanobacter sp. 7MK24]|uniref:hypothetical protein n=1 Tax=Rhodanobacter sp. 7MK24 TaxID=2775922 RepID=UPI001784FA87|nr:hypothetical protein [Rhodanobacter sp. 7MK24]MBD8878935.1 hypothetical protein [Rhodanobacter sp. 7MK24]
MIANVVVTMNFQKSSVIILCCRLSIVLPTALLVSGCAKVLKPDQLRMPARPTCIYLATPIISTAKHGILNIEWDTRLERGPYVSEREDDEGTYYRAPPGGISVSRHEQNGKSGSESANRTYDGGFWIPRDPNATPKLYTYFSTSQALVEKPGADIDCSSFGYINNPKTQGVSIVVFAVGGAIGGGVARATIPGAHVTYGQSVIGGAIGMAIVGALINMDVGKIMLGNPLMDDDLSRKIQNSAKQVVPLKENSATGGQGNGG